MKWLQIYITLLLAIMLGGYNAHAEKVSIAVGDWPPYLSEKLKHNGIIGHLLSDIFQAEGHQLSFEFVPWGRAYDEAKIGKQDMTGVWMHKPEREKDFLYSDPVLNEKFVFFHLKSTEFDWQTLQDLEGIAIGGGHEYSYGEAFDAALAAGKLTIERVTSKRLNWRKLFLGRILIYPEEITVGYSSLKQHFHSDKVRLVTHHPKPLLNNLSYVLFPKSAKKSRIYLQIFNERLKKFRQSGKYETYFKAFNDGYYSDE